MKNKPYVFHIIFFLVICLNASACGPLLDRAFKSSVPKDSGTLSIPGITEKVTIRRDALGVPFIRAENMHDLAFAMGYVQACDRISQMVGFRCMAQGRLSEMIGEAGLDIDLYMRTHNLAAKAKILLDALPQEMKILFNDYAEGVNTFLELYGDHLPPDLALSGFTPEKWRPVDSVSVFVLLSFGLGVNLHEELNLLQMASVVEKDSLPWLAPIYPDEDIPFSEGEKLSGVKNLENIREMGRLIRTEKLLSGLMARIPAASNNWVISRERTKKGASILANDTHLPISMPSLWMLMHARSPEFDAAGVSCAGIPGIVAGYNGKIAWGMTMVMADNQDIFLEKIRHTPDGLEYLYQGKWLAADKREEVFHIKGGKTRKVVIYETIHGPLLNQALLCERKHPLVPVSQEQEYGLAANWACVDENDPTLEGFLLMSISRTVEEALEEARKIRAIPLNLVLADKDNIAWQVTGRFPVRKKGRGLFPSPGWTGEYDWTGWLDVSHHPVCLNPEEGFIGTANHRKIPEDYPHVLSSSWFYPERGMRIDEMIRCRKDHDYASSFSMQLDQHSIFAENVKKMLFSEPVKSRITEEIASWDDPGKRESAEKGMKILEDFSGDLSPESCAAAYWGAFLYHYTRNTFYDELGTCASRADKKDCKKIWECFVDTGIYTYSAIADHLGTRGDESPFWDDITTSGKETKAVVLAKSICDAVCYMEKRFGKTVSKWQWGRMHTYEWIPDGVALAEYMGFAERTGMKLLSSYFTRGPFPAGGDHTTLNVSGYAIGEDFDVFIIPEMRIVVDFGENEPFYAVNSTGQSGNPASCHYADGNMMWLNGKYRLFPFQEENIAHQYTRILVLVPESE